MRPLAVVLVLLAVGCGDNWLRTPANPSSAPAPLGTFLVSGVVTELVDGMLRPLPNRSVWLWVSQDESSGGRYLTTDHDGRYAARVPKSRVFVTSLSSHLQQNCVATEAVDKDTTLDVQLVPSGSAANPPAAASPLITGIVYETTPAGRIAVRRAAVLLDQSMDNAVAWVYTDDEGRFFLCRVSVPVRLDVLGFSQLIAGTGDLHLEIEITR